MWFRRFRRIIGRHRQTDHHRDASDQRAFYERWEKWPGDPPAGGEIEEFIDDISGLTGVTPRPAALPPEPRSGPATPA
jgi:hypothetical protein